MSFLRTVVSALVLSRVDYCLSAFCGLPASRLKGLQSVLNASVRLTLRRSRSCHVTPLFHELGWLTIEHRISVRIASIVFSCLRRHGPTYLSLDLLPVSSIRGRSHLRSAAFYLELNPKLSAAVLSSQLQSNFGILCLPHSSLALLLVFVRDLKQHFLNSSAS